MALSGSRIRTDHLQLIISISLVLSALNLNNANSQSAASPPLNTTPKPTTGNTGAPATSLDSLKPFLQAALANQSKQLPQSASNYNKSRNNVNNAQQVSKLVGSDQQPQQSTAIRQLPITPSSLSSNDDPIIQLDYSSINDEVLRKRTANFVYFNANFNNCRHCYKFYSTWRELALDIRWWRQVVRLYVINCSDEDNIEVCRRAGVTQFPQVKFYWIMSQNLDQDGQRVRILGKSVYAMRHLILDKVLDSYNEHKLLLQRAQQQRAGTAGTAASSNPLLSLMPILTQLINTSGSSGGSSSGSGDLSGLMSMFMGGAGSSNNNNNKSPATPFSMTSLLSGSGLTDMIYALAGIASWRKSLSLQPMPQNWLDFDQIDVGTDTQRLLDWLPLDANRGIGALLVMETQEYLYAGLETMLDLSPYSNSTYLARVRDEHSSLTRNLTKRDDIQAPALIYISELREAKLLMTAPKFAGAEDLRRAFVRTFERRQIKYPVKRVWLSPLANASPTSSGSDSQEDEEILSKINNIYMNDLMNTIRASLMEQVFRHPDLSDDQYNALVKYVYALINYFPFNDDDGLKFFKRLHAWLQNQVSPMDIGEYKKQFHDVDEALGKRRDWIACKSLSGTKAIPSGSSDGSGGKSGAAGLLFENPAQFGKVISNITKALRTGQQKVGQLKSLIGMFTSNMGSSSSGNSNIGNNGTMQRNPSTTKAPNKFIYSSNLTTMASKTRYKSNNIGNSNEDNDEYINEDKKNNDDNEGNGKKQGKKEESTIERLFTSLTNGSLGSDSSILRLISSALTGGAGGSHKNGTQTGKSKFAREYSCGAWKLAHVMVVNEYLRDSPRKDVKHIVLHSLYQYMLHFYACPTCGNRVSDVSGEFKISLDDHLSDQGDSIMLIWSLHNRINKRLESEVRPSSPRKLQFPDESLCAKCRAPKAQNDIVATPNWHEKQVLNFLVHHYRPQNIITSSDSSSSSSSSSTSSDESTSSSADSNINQIASISILYLLSICSLMWAVHGEWNIRQHV